MKWRNKHRGSVSSSSSDNGSEDIRRSIEELDKVLDEFDDFSPKNATKVKKKNGIKPKTKEKCDNLSINAKLDPVRQSLDILDTVLAQFEDEINDTKDRNVSSNDEDSFDESTEIGGNDAERESQGSNDNLASPTSKQGKKVSPPPVPKRSPTTCLSCSSSFECPSPEINEKTASQKELFFPSATNCHRDSHQCSSRNCDKLRSSKKLSSRPVRKGSVRPKIKNLVDSATSQDDFSDEDDVFHQSNELIKDPDTSKVAKETRENVAEMIQSSAKMIRGNSNENVEISKEKFALAKYLIKTGQMRGLDEEPPTFKPPPIPLPPKTRINKNKTVDFYNSLGGNVANFQDKNGNELIKDETGTSEKKLDKSVRESTAANHVTSVKITQKQQQQREQTQLPSTIHSNNSNVSVITIQPKTLPSASNESVTVTKPALPPKEKNQFASTQQSSATSQIAKEKPVVVSQQQQQQAAPRVALSTFTRSTSTTDNNVANNNCNKSSSLEDVCSPNSRTQKAVVAADQLGMTKTGSLPLELKKPSGPTGGAVFFNVFQPDGEKVGTDHNEEETGAKDLPVAKDEVKEKRGWNKKKKKSKDSGKSSSKDSVTSNSNESIKGNGSTEQNALLAELTGKIQTKKSATPNASSSEDDDQTRNQNTEQLDKVANANSKDDKEKGIWKGFWKKKHSTAPET